MTEGHENRPRRAAADDSATDPTPATPHPEATPGRRALADNATDATAADQPVIQARRGLTPAPLVQGEQRPARSVRVHRAAATPSTATAASRDADTVLLPSVPADAAGATRADAPGTDEDEDTRIQPKINLPLARPEDTPEAPKATDEGAAAPPPAGSPWARPGSAAAAAAGTAATVIPAAAAAASSENTPANADSGSGDGAARPPRRSRSAGWAPASPETSARRRMLALGVAAAAALLTALTLVAYAAFGPDRQTVAGQPVGPTEPSAAPVLSEQSLINDSEASKIDDARSWQATRTVQGRPSDTPVPVCVGTDPNLPVPELSWWRQLQASGDDGTAAVHLTDAYPDAAQAEKVYANYADALAGCTRGGTFVITGGSTIKGVGDEAAAVKATYQGEENETHNVVIARTGRVVQVLDVTRIKNQVEMEPTVQALASAVNRQCSVAGGLCASGKIEVTDGPPAKPAKPTGLLLGSDVPRISKGIGAWGEAAVADRVSLATSTCVSQDLASAGGRDAQRQQSTMLLTNDSSAPENFGLDQVVITTKDDKAADALRKQLIDGITGCADDKLTAKANKVGGDIKVELGKETAQGAAFTAVEKQNASTESRFRLGVLSVGKQVIFVQANTTAKFDFTDNQWRAVVARAAERAVQA